MDATLRESSAEQAKATSTGASLTTVGFYLNRVRVVVNNAIEAGIIPATAYPFVVKVVM